jgi:hypothetical protein
MIREFHEEAARQEIMLVRKEHEVKLEGDAVKALVAGHELNMEELRRQKEEKRKAIVDTERMKRKSEIRQRNSMLKGSTGAQFELTAHMEYLRMGPSGLSGQAQRLPTFSEPEPEPKVPTENYPIPADASSNQPANNGAGTKKQKKGAKSAKKGAARGQVPNPKPDGASEKQQGGDVPEKAAWTSEPKAQAKPRGILKDTTARIDRKPTVEEVSDEDEYSRVEYKTEASKQANMSAGTFTEPNRQPSGRPFGLDCDDDKTAHFAWPTAASGSKQAMKYATFSPPEHLTESNMGDPAFSNGEDDQQYWNILNGGMGIEQQRGGVSQSAGKNEGKHAVWAPPTYQDDSADEGEDDSDLFQALALGDIPAHDVPSASWTRGSLPQNNYPVSAQNSNLIWRPDSRNMSKMGSAIGRGREVGAQGSIGEQGVFDTTSWEGAMMGILGSTHNSGSYA